MIERKRKGFTLVELLVVISIITMLMALALNAVQSAKESARQIQCSNNLKQLSMGVLLFNKTYGRFPGYRNHLKPSPKLVTWALPTFPYLEKQNIYNQWAKLNLNDTIGNEQAPMVHMEVFVCPSNPPRAEQVAPMDYVCNAGLVKQTDSAGNVFNLTLEDYPRNGVFLDHSENTKLKVTLDYLQSNDGSARTLMLGENLLVKTWTHWLRQDQISSIETYLPKQFMSFVWHPRGTGQSAYSGGHKGDLHPERRINGDVINFSLTAEQKYLNYARLASFHSQGANVTFCDGHGRFLSETLDYGVYIQLMTPDGVESKKQGETPYYVDVLNEGRY